MSFNNICVIGLGYIGLPTAAIFASKGMKVLGVDIDQTTIDTINQGKIHIIEPGLDKLVNSAVKSGHLRAAKTPESSDAFLIAVPTPFKKNKSEVPQPDLSYIKKASDAIAPFLKKGDLVILESTVPVGTTEQLAEWLQNSRPDLNFTKDSHDEVDINIAHCPERVLPGQILKELVRNDRVIGGITMNCSKRAIELYGKFVAGECIVTNARTAEMAKLTENSCRDVEIAFANELSMICDELDIDVWELISLSNRHPRINILQPGPGVGGHCIAVDPWFIISKTPKKAQLIHMARFVNNTKPGWVINKVKITITDFLQKHPDKTIRDITIACYGLTFKADIDDLRESPALNIAQKIAATHPGKVLAVEPNIDYLLNKDTMIDLSTFPFAQEHADIHLLLVDHKEFKDSKFKSEYLIDTKGIWN